MAGASCTAYVCVIKYGRTQWHIETVCHEVNTVRGPDFMTSGCLKDDRRQEGPAWFVV